MVPGRMFSIRISELAARRRQSASPSGLFEIDGQTALAGVEAEKVRSLAAGEGRTPGAADVAPGGVLNLENFRAVLSEQHRAVGSRRGRGEVEDAESCQRGHERVD